LFYEHLHAISRFRLIAICSIVGRGIGIGRPAVDKDLHRARWDARFAAEDYVFGTEPNVFLAGAAGRLRPGWKALVLADGEGRNGVWLARQGLEVTTVDFSAEGVAKARRLAERFGVTIRTVVADLNHWDWREAAFDVVVGVFMQVFAPPERAEIFARMKRALKPGGLLLLQGYRPEQIAYGTGGPSTRENLYTEEVLRAAFGDFSIAALRSHDSVIHEGSGHDGMSALIDLVAFKPPGSAGARAGAVG
jgi:SAM-dependent methyltransferase